MILVLAAIISGYAQPETKLFASNGNANDRMSPSVAIWDKYAIAGAPEDDCNGIKSGSVYFYELVNGNWIEKQNIIPTDGAANNEFGHSVAISGEWAAVGAWAQDNGSGYNDDGKVYIYRRDGNGVWSLFTTFVNDSHDRFGASVSLDNGYLAVGATMALVNGTGTRTGGVFIYRFNGSIWADKTELYPSDTPADGEFGYSVSISGSRLVTGANKSSPDGVNLAGAAYVYSRVGTVWSEDTKLVANDKAASDEYGTSVSIQGTKVVVGSPKDDDKGSKSGSVYFYSYSESVWTLSNKMTAFDGTSYAYYGLAVNFIDENNAVIGAQRAKINGVKTGAAYLYEYDSSSGIWKANSIDSQIVAGVGAQYDYFGGAVDGYGQQVFIGASKVDNGGSADWGAVYFYDISSVLPVELVDFKAEVVGTDVRLEWTTESEVNNEGFEIQRSLDGQYWEKIGWMPGVGYSEQTEHYSFIDENPAEKTNYYRLNQIDYDGKSEWSDIVSAYVKHNFTFSVYPNPTSDYLHLRYEATKDKIQSIMIYDELGRCVAVPNASAKNLDIRHLPKGYYLISIQKNDQFFNKSVLKR